MECVEAWGRSHSREYGAVNSLFRELLNKRPNRNPKCCSWAAGCLALGSSLLSCSLSGVQASSIAAFDVKMTKLGFLRLSYEKQDTLLKLLILSMAAVLCKSEPW